MRSENSMSNERPGILLVEDDVPIGKALAENLATYGGFEVFRAETVQAALDLARQHPALRFIYLDMKIKDFFPYNDQEVGGIEGRLAGLRLLRDLEKLLPRAKIYIKSAYLHFSPDFQEYTKGLESVIKVTGDVSWEDIAHLATRLYAGSGPEILIVHGHDQLTLQSLQNFIRHELKLGDPKILRDLPDNNRAVIEKFEYYARRADIVFALMTDDDVAGDQRRARQNVIFEIGYFMGAFGRLSRKLIILKKAQIEIPSDMSGIILIDVTNGFDADRFRRELKGWWGWPDKAVVSPNAISEMPRSG